jgi:primosomal protein N'
LACARWNGIPTDPADPRPHWRHFGGRAPVVVGALSALFLPYANLGLIIVDEEHDQA